MDASLATRRGRVMTAAVRAAFAWSARDRDVRAFREIARMTGVVMEARGPGLGPVTPGEFVAALQRPLRHILPAEAEAGAASAIDGTADAVLLTEDGRLADAVFELGCEYVQDVMASLDPATEWLPSWTWMQAEQVERAVFGQLIEGGSDDDYRAARRFLVEFPAGEEQALVDAANQRRARRVASYTPVDAEQVFEDQQGRRWWWPCPVCRWPMRADGVLVRCAYGPHLARYQVRLASRNGRPSLLRVGDSTPTPGRAQSAAGAVRVDTAVWRYITVPGAAELRLADRLRRLGATVVLWPSRDLYDLHIEAGNRSWKVDVKEHATVERLAEKLHARPPAAHTIVLPDSHRGWLHAVEAAIPNREVLMESTLCARVRRAVRRA
jgi:REase associating with pPIWI_RE/pPIWI_RE three-gene island domain Y